MKQKLNLLPILVFLPIQIISTSQGTSASTNVKTEGNSKVYVEQKVNSNSESTVEVHTNTSSVTGQIQAAITGIDDQKVKSRVEVEVNGQKKVVESDKPGSINVAVSENGQVDFQKSANSSTLTQYIVERIQTLLKNIFSGFWRK